MTLPLTPPHAMSTLSAAPAPLLVAVRPPFSFTWASAPAPKAMLTMCWVVLAGAYANGVSEWRYFSK